VKRLRSLAALDRELEHLGAELVGSTRRLEDQFESRAVSVVRRLSPRGSQPARKIRLARSWRALPGRRSGAGSIAPHGAVIDYGRRYSRAAGKVLGSPQAPRGIGSPATKELQKHMGRMVEKSIGRVFS